MDGELSVYVAGGYADRATAGAVADLLRTRFKVRIAFDWWSGEPVVGWPALERAEGEAKALCTDTDLLVVLDAFAGTGTATEMGIAIGAGVELVWVRANDKPTQLAWFGALSDVIEAVAMTWDPEAIVEAVVLTMDGHGIGFEPRPATAVVA